MSAKISDVYKQNKTGKAEAASGRKQKSGLYRPAQKQGDQHIDEWTERQLLVFDLTNKYGPCTGLTRLERWERAEKLGLDPPRAVKDIVESAEEPRRTTLNTATWENRGI